MPRISYVSAQRTIEATSGETILQASLRCGIAHTHECGGVARCSTCRVMILEGLEHCAPRNAQEQAMAERLHFGPAIRLACQTRVAGDLSLRRLVLDAEDVLITDQRGAGADPGMVGEERTVAIMFADVRAFTSFAEPLPAYDVVHTLNRIFCRTGAVIARHGGHIDNYMGDGLMALFEAPETPTASLRAVRAGLGMLAAVEQLQPYFRENYGRELRLGIGIHCGEVVIGSIGALGTKRTTAIGDAVNLASRIENANKLLGTGLLISDAIHGQVGDRVMARRHEGVCLPGKAGVHTLHEVLGLRQADGPDDP